MRVCHVVNSVGPSTGPANHAVALVKHTEVEAGILSWFGKTNFDEQELLTEVTCLDASHKKLGMGRKTLAEAKDVLSNYDVVHVHHPHSGSISKIIGSWLGKRIVSTEGTDHSKFTYKGRVANGLTNRFSDKVTCVSGSVHDSFKRWEDFFLSSDQVEVIYTGVDMEKIERGKKVTWDLYEETEVNRNSIIVGHAARLFDAKGQDVLIKAIAKASERGDKNFELVIAGTGDIKDDLVDVAVTNGVLDQVHFLGLLDRLEVYRLMEQSDIYAMPSRWEGFSSAVLEAMAIGTPCVLSDIDSFTRPFQDVAVFHRIDGSSSLANQLLELAESEKLRNELSEKAKKRVKSKYSMKKTAENYSELYSEILDDDKTSHVV